MKHKFKVWMRAYRIWQHTPHKVAPNDEQQHVCKSCGTEFCGHYCPRCGQSERVGRFSFKTAFQLFLNNWGLGNRDFFVTVRDLMFRPGFLIRDYVSGRQSSYFPPFQLFFVVAALSLLIDEGVKLNVDKQQQEAQTEVAEKSDKDWITVTKDGKEVHSKTAYYILRTLKVVKALENYNPALFSLMLLMLVSLPLYIFFRRCPAIPDLRLSEHMVALVFISSSYTIIRLIGDVLTFGGTFRLIAVVMVFVAMRQFTGYSRRRLLLYLFLTFLILLILFVVIVALAILIIAMWQNELNDFAA